MEDRIKEQILKVSLSRSSDHHLILAQKQKEELERKAVLRAEKIEAMKLFREEEHKKRVQALEKKRLEKEKVAREKMKVHFISTKGEDFPSKFFHI